MCTHADNGTVLVIGWQLCSPFCKAMDKVVWMTRVACSHAHTQTADIIAAKLEGRVEVVKDPRLRERVGYCVLACM